MPLIERLMGLEEPKLPTHQFIAAVAENTRGEMTNQQIIDAFALDPGEQTEAVALRDRVTTGPTGDRLNRALIHDVLLLAEQGIAPYGSAQAVRDRFGI
jgi:hypothetical protein